MVGGDDLPEVVSDQLVIPLVEALPPGEYTVEVGVYDAATGARLPAYDAAGNLLGDHLVLQSVDVQ